MRRGCSRLHSLGQHCSCTALCRPLQARLTWHSSCTVPRRPHRRSSVTSSVTCSRMRPHSSAGRLVRLADSLGFFQALTSALAWLAASKAAASLASYLSSRLQCTSGLAMVVVLLLAGPGHAGQAAAANTGRSGGSSAAGLTDLQSGKTTAAGKGYNIMYIIGSTQQEHLLRCVSSLMSAWARRSVTSWNTSASL